MVPCRKCVSWGMDIMEERTVERGMVEVSMPSIDIAPEFNSIMRNRARTSELFPLEGFYHVRDMNRLEEVLV